MLRPATIGQPAGNKIAPFGDNPAAAGPSWWPQVAGWRGAPGGGPESRGLDPDPVSPGARIEKVMMLGSLGPWRREEKGMRTGSTG
jgi:hypothetical protein